MIYLLQIQATIDCTIVVFENIEKLLSLNLIKPLSNLEVKRLGDVRETRLMQNIVIIVSSFEHNLMCQMLSFPCIFNPINMHICFKE